MEYTDLALLANTPAQTKSVSSLEKAARGIGFYVNSDKMELMCFKQDGDISKHVKPLKLVDQFTFLGSNISSTENNINIYIGKAWAAIGRLLIIWKSDL